MITLPELIDAIGRNIDRIKTVGVLVLVALVIMSAVNNGCNRTQLENMVEKVTGLNVKNDILQSGIKIRDSVLIAQNDSIQRLKDEITVSKSNESQLALENVKIKRKYNDLASILIKIPADSSYAFLDRVAYPYLGEKKYPFSDPQVKGIHKTYLEHEQLLSLNENLQEQKDELSYQIELHGALELETSSSMMVMQETRRDLEEIIENKDGIIATNEKALKKAKRRAFWAKVGIGAGALIIGFIAGG